MTQKLLLVGPLPPPIGGSPLTVQAMVEELCNHPSVQLEIINSSPARDVRKKMTGFNFEKVTRLFSVTSQYVQKVRNVDVVMVYANNLFIITTIPLMFFIARLFKKAFYIKPVGGDLDLFIEQQPKFLKNYILGVMRSADGILSQTRLLQKALIDNGCPKTYYLPGFRPNTAIPTVEKEETTALRLVFLAHIFPEKGPLVLLDALRQLSQEKDVEVTCDFYGPIHDIIKDEFTKQVQELPNARYCGVAAPGTGSEVIAHYDMLVLPTYFSCEGHTGVIIEAMHVGVPVISTRHRSVPELVTDGVNGMLVPPQDSQALAAAIRKAAQNRPWIEQLGKANLQCGQEYTAEVVVSNMLEMLFNNHRKTAQP